MRDLDRQDQQRADRARQREQHRGPGAQALRVDREADDQQDGDQRQQERQ